MHTPGIIRSLRFCALAVLGFAAFDAVAQSEVKCDAACLKTFADGYFAALAERNPAALQTAPEVKYTENGRVQPLGMGLWKTAGKQLEYRDYLFDPQSGGVAELTAVREYDDVAQTFLRLKVVDRRITEIETLVARAGDQRWFAPENLERLSDVFAQPVSAAQRGTRAQLALAANAYFTAVQTEGTPEFEQAPFGRGVKRFENGLQTTNNDTNPVLDRHRLSPEEQLVRAFYKGITVDDRRFPIVDVEHGSVLGLGTFRTDGPDSTTLLLAEIFKVTDGKIREIRAIILNAPHGTGTGWSTAPHGLPAAAH